MFLKRLKTRLASSMSGLSVPPFWQLNECQNQPGKENDERENAHHEQTDLRIICTHEALPSTRTTTGN